MSPKTIDMSGGLYSYMLEVGVRESHDAKRLREQTQAMQGPSEMQISPEQGQFMGFLARLTGAKRAIEVGTFTGYSAMAVVQAMGPDGRLVACDVNPEWTALARQAWADAGIASQIELRLAPASETLDGFIRDGRADSFDMAFIDADKENYPIYFDRLLRLVRPGGLILADNVLWGGAVANSSDQRPSTKAIRAFNEQIHRDERIDMSLVPIGDGLTLIRRR